MATICFDILTQGKSFGTSKCSFMWVCWLSPKPFVLSCITTSHVTGECYATSMQKWLAWAPTAMRQCCVFGMGLGPSRPWKHSSGSVQQIQKVMTRLKKLKPVFSYFFSFLLTTCTNPPRLTFFPHKLFTIFSWKPFAVLLYHSWGSKVQVQWTEGNEPDRTHGNPCMVPAWPSLLALTGGC